MSSLTLLGTGTCEIELERRASSVLIKLDSLHVLFDCGHGVLQRLLEVGVQHKDIEHVVLSHFHPDHVSDLVPLFHAGAWSRSNPRGTDLHIYGPPGVQKLIDGLVSIFGMHAFATSSYNLIVHEVIEGGHITDEQIVELAVASQAKTIVCSHLYREINVDHLQAHAEQQGYQGTIEVGQDLESYVI